jgi:prepilin-type N-terminal cleavage/methylation domain-containing protein
MRRPTSQARRRLNLSRLGFTLSELLITLAIITLVLALAVPVFNVISGARTIEAAQNVLAARITQARTIAINRGQFVGVMIFRDPLTDRWGSILVSFNNSNLEDPDTLEKYKGWFGTSTAGGNTTYLRAQPGPPVQLADRVLRVVSDFRGRVGGGSWDFLEGKPMTYLFRVEDGAMVPVGNASWGTNTSTDPVTPTPNAAPVPSASFVNGPNPSSFYWRQFSERVGKLDVLASGEGETQLLPNGVGAQMITSLVATSSTATNRYAQAGLILFSPNGEVVQRPYSIAFGSPLHRVIYGVYSVGAADRSNYITIDYATSVAAPNIDRTIVATNRPSQCDLGVALFDLNSFKGASHTISDGLGFSNPANADFPSPDLTDYTDAKERTEEEWLDNNAVLLLVNRYSGALGESQ